MGERFRGLAVFLSVSFGPALAIDIVILRLQPPMYAALPLLLARMALPMAGAIAALRAVEALTPRQALRRLGVVEPSGLRALLEPSLLAVTGYIVGTALARAYTGCEACQLLQHSILPLPVLAVAAIALGVAAGVSVNMVAALLEEAGWRGYLYPRLSRLLGSRGAGAVAAGTVWGLWHAPLVWNGYNYRLGPMLECVGTPGAGPVAVAVFTLYAASLGLMLAWEADRWGTVLSAAAGHGTVNAVAGLFAALCVGPRLLAPPAGLLVAAGIGLALLAAMAASRLKPCRPAVQPTGEGAG